MSIKSDRRSVKNELKIMSMIKTLSQDAFELCSSGDVYSFEQQERILKLQRDCISGLKSQETYSQKMLDTVDAYIVQLDDKIGDLVGCILNEKLYYNTMPQNVFKAKQAQDDLNNLRLFKFEQNIAMIPLPRNNFASINFKKKRNLPIQQRKSSERNLQVVERSQSIVQSDVNMQQLQLIQKEKESLMTRIDSLNNLQTHLSGESAAAIAPGEKNNAEVSKHINTDPISSRLLS